MSDSKPNKNRRKLTSFLCREMLYDYVQGTLDEDRRSAVDEYLKTDADCRQALEGLRRGLAYGEALRGTRLRPEIIAGLAESENAVSLGRKYSSWSSWPDEMRWTIGFVTVSILVAGIAVTVPWSKLKVWKSGPKSDAVELAQLSKPGDSAEKLENQEGDTPAEQGSGDEEIETPDQAVAVGKPNAKPNAKSGAKLAAKDEENDDEGANDDEGGDEPAPPHVAAAKAAKPAATPAAKAVPVTPAAAVAATVPASSATAEPEEKTAESESHEAKPKGFVYRAFMNTPELDDVAPKIAQQIAELGGTKAGEVDLGWKRGSGRYYHFALPEENQEKLLEKLRAYGPVRISKDPHSRVMPAGQVRFILWVEASH